MTIARRFLNMARTELNSLLDLAAKHSDDPGDGDSGGGHENLHGFTAKELEEELERRRSARQEVEDAIHGRRTPEPPPRTGGGSTSGGGSNSGGSGSGGGSGGGGRGAPTSGLGGEALRVQKAYAALEVPPGSDFQAVRKAYRALMRKYHPDHHTQTAEKQRAANEVAQRLTDAYKILEKKLRK